MVDQDILDRTVFAALRDVFPRYQGRIFANYDIERMRSEIVSVVQLSVHDPFRLELENDGNGMVKVWALPLETAAEKAKREAREAREHELAMQRAREAAIELAKQQNAAHPERATVQGSDAEPFVSIPGMIADIRRWHAPPELWNEEAVGFRRALEDVERYLLARARRR